MRKTAYLAYGAALVALAGLAACGGTKTQNSSSVSTTLDNGAVATSNTVTTNTVK